MCIMLFGVSPNGCDLFQFHSQGIAKHIAINLFYLSFLPSWWSAASRKAVKVSTNETYWAERKQEVDNDFNSHKFRSEVSAADTH